MPGGSSVLKQISSEDMGDPFARESRISYDFEVLFGEKLP
jgi:hypothetical protein